MKVAYLVTWSGDGRTGVFKKIADQVSMWTRLGVDAGVFVATTPGSESAWGGIPEVRQVETFTTALESFRVQRPLLGALRSWGADISYVRTTPRHFFVGGALGRIPHVIEIQTDDLSESKGLSPARHALTRATRKRCLGGATGLVFVSRELARLTSYEQFTKARTVIGNGIDFTRIPHLPPPQNTAPRLAFMGLPGAPWHGIEDILLLAEHRPAWTFDLIGPSATALRLPPNVSAHGELSASEYRPILEQADAAISSLAWYRNGMNEASPLKSREYLALGLPVIGGYSDTDIPQTSDVYLQVANRPRAILDDVSRVESFVHSWMGRRVPRDQIAGLDTTAKETQRLEFFAELLQGSTTP